MTMVRVQFPDGPRDVEAHYEEAAEFGLGFPRMRAVPNDIPGYRLMETIGSNGGWQAIKENN